MVGCSTDQGHRRPLSNFRQLEPTASSLRVCDGCWNSSNHICVLTPRKRKDKRTREAQATCQSLLTHLLRISILDFHLHLLGHLCVKRGIQFFWIHFRNTTIFLTQYPHLQKNRDFSIYFQFSHSVISDSLRPHGLQHARPPCPSPTPRAYSNSCP